MTTNRQDRLAVALRALIYLADDPRGMATSAELGDALDVHAVEIRRLLGKLRSEGLADLLA